MRIQEILVISLLIFSIIPSNSSLKNPGKETWSYVEVRPGAFMFWWLYYSGTVDYMKKPLVIWLQGGPGASSTGFGNFEEIGPLDVNLNNRTHSWLNWSNLLFVDNPVGCGFSYVNDTKLLVKNNKEIVSDLIEMISRFFEKVPEFQTVPLYIFGESYGGKMVIEFGLKLYKKMQQGKIKCNLKGVSLGDSWISPIDSTLTWAPYLYSTSLVDEDGLKAINKSAYGALDAMNRKEYKKATELWDETEGVISKYTNGVNVYNILDTDEIESLSKTKLKKGDPIDTNTVSEENAVHKGRKSFAKKHLARFHSDPLALLMNDKIKKKLRIVPENVVWGGQSGPVFDALREDFMKPVTKVVESLLNNTQIAVNVYSGQLDMIVDTIGTLKWVEEMNWVGIPNWRKAYRKPITINNSTEMFVRSYKNFAFYWILKAGHMVPQDRPLTAVEMLKMMINLKRKTD